MIDQSMVWLWLWRLKLHVVLRFFQEEVAYLNNQLEWTCCNSADVSTSWREVRGVKIYSKYSSSIKNIDWAASDKREFYSERSSTEKEKTFEQVWIIKLITAEFHLADLWHWSCWVIVMVCWDTWIKHLWFSYCSKSNENYENFS